MNNENIKHVLNVKNDIKNVIKKIIIIKKVLKAVSTL